MLDEAVAVNTDASQSEVATLFWQRLSSDIQRSAHRAFARRLPIGCQEDGCQAAANMGFVGLLEMPAGV